MPMVIENPANTLLKGLLKKVLEGSTLALDDLRKFIHNFTPVLLVQLNKPHVKIDWSPIEPATSKQLFALKFGGSIIKGVISPTFSLAELEAQEFDRLKNAVVGQSTNRRGYVIFASSKDMNGLLFKFVEVGTSGDPRKDPQPFPIEVDFGKSVRLLGSATTAESTFRHVLNACIENSPH